MMMHALTLEEKLSRVIECGAGGARDDISRSLLHAYTACLNIDELAEAAIRTINGPLEIRRAVRNRLARVGQEGKNQTKFDRFGERVMELTAPDSKAVIRIDALLSQIYYYFSPPIRQEILDRWRDRGTRSAAARWLKALSSDDLLFSLNDVLLYWQATGDVRAAIVLAKRADAALLSESLPELVSKCDEGWIVSRVALGAKTVSDECWTAIRSKFPASYAYLCAKTGRALNAEEALCLVIEAGVTWPSDERGLAILGDRSAWDVACVRDHP